MSRTRYRRQPDGEREFLITVRNVGSIRCQAELGLANRIATPVDAPISLEPGATRDYWAGLRFTDNDIPPGILAEAGTPQNDAGGSACVMETVGRLFVRSATTPVDNFAFYGVRIRNSGTATCSYVQLFTRL